MLVTHARSESNQTSLLAFFALGEIPLHFLLIVAIAVEWIDAVANDSSFQLKPFVTRQVSPKKVSSVVVRTKVRLKLCSNAWPNDRVLYVPNSLLNK